MKDETIKLKKGTAQIFTGPEFDERFNEIGIPAFLKKSQEMQEETMKFMKDQIERHYPEIKREAWDMDAVMVNFISRVAVDCGGLIRRTIFESDEEFKEFWDGLLKGILSNKMQK